MCKAEFEMITSPSKKASYSDLFEEIKCIGKGSFGAAFLVRSRLKDEFLIAKKIRFNKEE